MSLRLAVLVAIRMLPVFHEDRGEEFAVAKSRQLEEVAYAVADVSAMQRIAIPSEWAALMVAVAYHESGLSLRIHRGECSWERRECDASWSKGQRVFLARGLWQLHRYAEAREWWEQMHGIEHTAKQVEVVSARLRRGYYVCRGKTDWLIGTVNGFAGKRCDAIWPGLEARAATWRGLRTTIQRELAKARARKTREES